MRRIATFPHQIIKTIELQAMQRYLFFVHPENILLSMLEKIKDSEKKIAKTRKMFRHEVDNSV